MSTGYQICDQNNIHFITCSIVDWVDIFSRRSYRDMVMNSLTYCKKEKGLLIYGYVIMTNHIHLIVSSSNGTLSDTIRDFKKFTANTILKTLQTEPESRREWMVYRFRMAANMHSRNTNYQLWSQENHAIEITTEPFYLTKLNYIHLNPVRSGWVEQPEHYLYSSAKQYFSGNRDGLISFWDR